MLHQYLVTNRLTLHHRIQRNNHNTNQKVSRHFSTLFEALQSGTNISEQCLGELRHSTLG